MSSCFRAPEIHAVVIYLVHNITCIIIIVKLFSIISMIEGKCEFSHSAQRPNAHKTPHSRNNNRNFYYISWVFSSLLYTSKVNVMNTNTRNWWSRKINGQNKIEFSIAKLFAKQLLIESYTNSQLNAILMSYPLRSKT